MIKEIKMIKKKKRTKRQRSCFLMSRLLLATASPREQREPRQCLPSSPWAGGSYRPPSLGLEVSP